MFVVWLLVWLLVSTFVCLYVCKHLCVSVVVCLLCVQHMYVVCLCTYVLYAFEWGKLYTNIPYRSVYKHKHFFIRTGINVLSFNDQYTRESSLFVNYILSS